MAVRSHVTGTGEEMKIERERERWSVRERRENLSSMNTAYYWRCRAYSTKRGSLLARRLTAARRKASSSPRFSR